MENDLGLNRVAEGRGGEVHRRFCLLLGAHAGWRGERRPGRLLRRPALQRKVLRLSAGSSTITMRRSAMTEQRASAKAIIPTRPFAHGWLGVDGCCRKERYGFSTSSNEAAEQWMTARASRCHPLPGVSTSVHKEIVNPGEVFTSATVTSTIDHE